MLYLEHKRNRIILMTVSIIVVAALSALLIEGINAVGVLMATSIINIFVYYALPGRYSREYMDQYLNRMN